MCNVVLYRITGNICEAKFLSFKYLRDLIFTQTEHVQYKIIQYKNYKIYMRLNFRVFLPSRK